MPNRILREGIITSRRMAELENFAGWFGEVFYRRLMSKVDDYGRYTADPALLRPELFPRQLEKVREPDMSRLLAACEKAGLITLYTLSGEVYLEMRDFRQQTRAKASKYPPPPASDDRMRSTCVADAQHVRAYTETETETETDKPLSAVADAGGAYPPGLLRLWEHSPPKARDRSSRQQCLAEWKRQKCASIEEKVIAGMEAWKRSEKWLENDGQFIEGLHRWIKARKWDELPSSGRANGHAVYSSPANRRHCT